METEVTLTYQEIGLLRAGLAAHMALIKGEKGVDAREQARECRSLSIRLGEVQASMGENS